MKKIIIIVLSFFSLIQLKTFRYNTMEMVTHPIHVLYNSVSQCTVDYRSPEDSEMETSGFGVALFQMFLYDFNCTYLRVQAGERQIMFENATKRVEGIFCEL
jgi:hypothetical protein